MHPGKAAASSHIIGSMYFDISCALSRCALVLQQSDKRINFDTDKAIFQKTVMSSEHAVQHVIKTTASGCARVP